MLVQSPQVVREFLIAELKDAHAMESQAVSLTSAQVNRWANYPDLDRRIRQHLEETEMQLMRIRQCLRTLDASPNALKDAAFKVGANLAATLHAMTGDDVVKNSLASYAFEHFEIATYKALIETATLADRADIVEICSQNLAEEESMAAWLGENQSELVRQYLTRKSTEAEAKR